MLLWILPTFFCLLLIGLPVFFCLLAAPGILLWVAGQEQDIAFLYRNLYDGMNSFPLTAVPLFMLTAELMKRGGFTSSLIEVAQALLGRVRGGLAYVNILSSMFFSGLSGSAVAETSSRASALIPTMEAQGYSKRFATALTAAGSVIGPIIPPSGILIIYAYVMAQDVKALFLAGIGPGLLLGVGLLIAVRISMAFSGAPLATQADENTDPKQASLKALFPLLTPVIILVGILSGAVAPSEAAALAVVYAALIGLFVTNTLKARDLPDVLTSAGITSAVVLLLVGAAMSFKTVVSLSHAPDLLADWILTLTQHPLLLLFLINLLLLVVGMVLDTGPAIIILGPLLSPIFIGLGVEPIHFAIIMTVTLTIGLATPPLGLALRVAASVSHERLRAVAWSVLPLLVVQILLVLLITCIPEISLTLPRLVGVLNLANLAAYF